MGCRGQILPPSQVQSFVIHAGILSQQVIKRMVNSPHGKFNSCNRFFVETDEHWSNGLYWFQCRTDRFAVTIYRAGSAGFWLTIQPFNCQRKTTQSLGYLPRTEIQKYCQNLLISNLVTLDQYPAFPLGLSFTQTGLWERERSWSRKKRGLPGCAENWGFSHSCFKVYCLRQRYWSRCLPLNKRIQPQIACWSLITLLFSEGFSFTSREI